MEVRKKDGIGSGRTKDGTERGAKQVRMLRLRAGVVRERGERMEGRGRGKRGKGERDLREGGEGRGGREKGM
jgi:hypothetical protein